MELRLEGITKAFHGRRVNDQIDLQIRSGEIVGLLGENGAGKTTLMNILFGLYHADAGRILLDGRDVRFKSPREALAAGIGMVHQHFQLVRRHTVAENLAAALPGAPWWNPVGWAKRRLAEFSRDFDWTLDPDAVVEDLAAGELQRLEILKALLAGARCLILDEPTSVLAPPEARQLFTFLKKLTDRGAMAIVISHKLEEILEWCGRVVVLQKGRVTGERPTAGADRAELARLMVGREISARTHRPEVSPGAAILEVENLQAQGDRGEAALQGLSFTVRQSEIFGIAGVAGNGQRELAEVVTGLRRAAAGQVRLDGLDVTNRPVKYLNAKGLGHVPEERMRFGIVPNLLVFENALLKDTHAEAFTRRGLLDLERIQGFAQTIVETFRIATPNVHTPIKHLSGGNIQKLILGREIQGDPSLLVASHPTYGLDVGAAQGVREALMKRRSEGGAVLLISEDLEELMDLSDRIGVLFQGQLVATVERGQADLTQLGLWMAGVKG